MDHKNDSTNNVKAPEEKFIEAVTQKALEVLVAIRLIVHFDDTDGMNKRRIRRGFNHLTTPNRRRRD